MSGIFISYRQDDAKPWALLLRGALASAFGEEQVFLDKDTLHAGNWRDQIQQALDRCSVVLVVIGRGWLRSADERGRRRLDNPQDVHRQEIAYALSRKNVTVIPVTVDGAPVPFRDELPEDLRPLTEQQSRELSDMSARREVDLALLLNDIERVTGLVATGVQTARNSTLLAHEGGHSPRSRFRAGWLISAAVLSIAILVIADTVLVWSLDPVEKSFIVVLVVLMALGVSRLSTRWKAREHDQT